nr:hypothetical protein [Tanacetum cinerariifolium]
MSEPADLIPTPTSIVRNTMGKGYEQTLENKNRLASDAALREYYDKYYHQLLSIITKKVHKENAQQDKLKEVTTHLNFEGCSKKREDPRSVTTLQRSLGGGSGFQLGTEENTFGMETAGSWAKEKILTEGETSGINRGSILSKKPNGPGHRTPYWFQRRNHMANGTNITTNENRGYGTFNCYMDELSGGKITISIQWDHRKAMSKENSSSPVNGSWNVKIPNPGGHYKAARLSHSNAQWSQDQKHNIFPALGSRKKKSKWQFTQNTQSKN